jgi:carbon-monoxide dehydrogenase medium subunit
MIQTALRYHAPRSFDETCAVLAAAQRPVILGGGTMTVPGLGRGERAATDVVHLRGLGLDQIAVVDGGLEVGAMTTYTDLLSSEIARRHADLLVTVASKITGGAQIRNLGTVGGSACYANPSSDIPATLVALDAVMVLRSAQGVRRIAASEFYVDAFRTVVGSEEFLTSVVLPIDESSAGYYKLKLSESSWPIATAAAVVWRNGDAWQGRLALGGVRSTPVRIDVTSLLDEVGRIPAEQYDTVRRLVEEELDAPWDDELAPAEYRRAVAPTVAERAVTALNERLARR